MKRKNHLISIKTLTDNHLESFISCHNKFYHQYILRKNSGEVQWRQMVQFSVHKIILNYYRLPLKEQNEPNLLKLIEQYREYIHPKLFENKVHYYRTLAKITEHLILFLTTNRHVGPPLFLYEKLQVAVKELNTNLSLTIDMGAWVNHSFVIKKFLLDADERTVSLYKYLLVVFSKNAFGVLPDQIELLSLADGSRHIITPTEQDAVNGLKYLEWLKNHIQKPEYYQKQNCHHCSECIFNKECDSSTFQNENRTDCLKASLKSVLH
ncbi:hypothetical protein [Niallia endozanthoxylica]|uniref:PD-(D/E)XK endonuclease-like domain-containing protein n=1 Tax=Niallia endozanthoxylica TaxID=2036016 RepID=A0A5J5H048_9BACI|nr:hypothetical protein [Niallia endozanthoxylica]KAA9013233.1 hypothetical protein F4V44_24880 [Niallia endozanthoxylica]